MTETIITLLILCLSISRCANSASLMVGGSSSFSDMSKYSFNFNKNENSDGLTRIVGKGFSSEVEQIDLRMSHSLFSLTPHYIRHTKGDSVWQMEHFEERVEYKRNNVAFLQLLLSDRLNRHEFKFIGLGNFKDVVVTDADMNKRVLDNLCQIDALINEQLAIPSKYSMTLCHSHVRAPLAEVSVQLELEFVSKILSHSNELLVKHTNKTTALVHKLQAEVSNIVKQDVSKQVEELLAKQTQEKEKQGKVHEIAIQVSDHARRVSQLESNAEAHSKTISTLQADNTAKQDSMETHLEYLEETVYSLSQFVNRSLSTFNTSLDQTLDSVTNGLVVHTQHLDTLQQNMSALHKELTGFNHSVTKHFQLFSHHFLTFAEKQQDHLYQVFLPSLTQNISVNQSITRSHWEDTLEAAVKRTNTSFTDLQHMVQQELTASHTLWNETLQTFALQQQVQVEDIQDTTEIAIQQLHRKLHATQLEMNESMSNTSETFLKQVQTLQDSHKTVLDKLTSELTHQKTEFFTQMEHWNTSIQGQLTSLNSTFTDSLSEAMANSLSSSESRLQSVVQTLSNEQDKSTKDWKESIQVLNTSIQIESLMCLEQLTSLEEDWSGRWHRQQAHWTAAHHTLHTNTFENITALQEHTIKQHETVQSALKEVTETVTNKVLTESKSLQDIIAQQRKEWEETFTLQKEFHKKTVDEWKEHTTKQLIASEKQQTQAINTVSEHVFTLQTVDLPAIQTRLTTLNTSQHLALHEATVSWQAKTQQLAEQTNTSMISLQQDLVMMEWQWQENLKEVQNEVQDQEVKTQKQFIAVEETLQDHTKAHTAAWMAMNISLQATHETLQTQQAATQTAFTAMNHTITDKVSDMYSTVLEDLTDLKQQVHDQFTQQLQQVNTTLQSQQTAQSAAIDTITVWMKEQVKDVQEDVEQQVKALTKQQSDWHDALQTQVTSLVSKQTLFEQSLQDNVQQWKARQTESFGQLQETMKSSLQDHSQRTKAEIESLRSELETKLQTSIEKQQDELKRKWTQWQTEYSQAMKDFTTTSTQQQLSLEQSMHDLWRNMQHNVSYWQFTTDFTMKQHDSMLAQVQQQTTKVQDSVSNMSLQWHTVIYPEILLKQQQGNEKVLSQVTTLWEKQSQSLTATQEESLRQLENKQTQYITNTMKPLQERMEEDQKKIQHLEHQVQSLSTQSTTLEGRCNTLQQTQETSQQTQQEQFLTLQTSTKEQRSGLQSQWTQEVATQLTAYHSLLTSHSKEWQEAETRWESQESAWFKQSQLLQDMQSTQEIALTQQETLYKRIQEQETRLSTQTKQLDSATEAYARLAEAYEKQQSAYFTLSEKLLAYQNRQQEKDSAWMTQVASQQQALSVIENKLSALTMASSARPSTAAVEGEQVSISKNEYDTLLQKVNHVEVMVLQQMMSLVNTLLQQKQQ